MTCKDCVHFKDIKNPVYGWCLRYKMDVHPEWELDCVEVHSFAKVSV